jgi:2-polyprenyl-3-methyl-5-hydroxy-6-metoxy-1,4-benzoquinol methylase
MDRPMPLEELARTLGDIARLNGLFGGRWLTLRRLRRLVEPIPPNRTLTVLDVGTGGADMPVALARWARRAGRRIRVVALDRDPPTLAIARRSAARYREISFVRGDAAALPVRPQSIDVVISALTLHPMTPVEGARAIAEMDGAAHSGFVVNDLARSRTAYALVWLATRFAATTRASRHDGPMSVRRAYTPGELRALCQVAGASGARVRRYPWLARQCAERARA